MIIGILGGGQLGRMLVQEASRLDLDVVVMDKEKNYPAPNIWPHFVQGDFTNYDDVINFGMQCDVITIEIESINVEALKYLQSQGKNVYPQPEVIEIIADKGFQKQFYKDNNIPTSDFRIVNSENVKSYNYDSSIFKPFVQKLRTGGYDGKGVQLIHDIEALENIWIAPSVFEELINIEKEISIIVCRNTEGKIVAYPCVEMEFHPTANLVEFLFCPSTLTEDQENEAKAIAIKIAEKLGIVGLLAVEMFVDINGKILVNEVAPRPHNSGHNTIEASYTSQFEQHLRAIADLPLGNTESILPSVMINLLGELGYEGETCYLGLANVLAIDGVYPHLYGKKQTKPMRKMGHITIIDNDLQKAFDKARKVKNLIKIVST